jgi:hypothetical protein
MAKNRKKFSPSPKNLGPIRLILIGRPFSTQEIAAIGPKICTTGKAFDGKASDLSNDGCLSVRKYALPPT